MKLIAQSLFSHFFSSNSREVKRTQEEDQQDEKTEKNAKDHFNGNATNGNNSIKSCNCKLPFQIYTNLFISSFYILQKHRDKRHFPAP